MKKMILEAPNVADSFFKMTDAIREHSSLDAKTRELIIIGIFTAHRGLKGLTTHVKRAIENGASSKDIYSAILLALPIVGITDVNLAIEHIDKELSLMVNIDGNS